MRLFIAAELDEAASRGVAEAAGKLVRRAEAAGWRATWVKPEAIHLTLKFLGEVGEGKLPSIEQGLTNALVGANAFPLQVDGLGTFPPSGRPKVLFLAIRKGAPEAVDLAARVEAALGPLGFPSESRRFHPHLTLGRVKKAPRDGLASLVRETAPISGRVVGVTLFRSFLGEAGARHQPLHRVPLGVAG